MKLEGDVAVVTGGANGIGLAAARRLRDSGAIVVVADANPDAVTTLADEPGLHGVVCDVRSESDISALADAANNLGPVSLVMANAGIAIGGRFELVPSSEWSRLFDVNVIGAVRTINAFLPDMLQADRGRIVVTGSSAGLFRGEGFDAPYAASKHALRAMAEGLAVYCQSTGVDVHYLAPRITDTAFPKSSVAWGRRGSRVTSDRELGADYDTVDTVVDALFEAIKDRRFLISLTPDSEDRLIQLATTPPSNN